MNSGSFSKSEVANPTRAATASSSSRRQPSPPRWGKLYMGVAASSDKACGYIAGRIVAVDLAGGASISRTLVDPGQIGTPIWSSISVDEPAGLVYASTGGVWRYPHYR